MDKIRIAIATRGHKGLEDKLSKVYGKAKTFTLVDIEEGEVKNVKIVDNPGATYDQGSGPIASKTLAELKIDLVLASQLGPGALELLRCHKIDTIIVDVNSTIAEAIEEALSRINN